MIYKKWKLEIPDYITHIKLSEQRRAKYYTISEEEKIPKKYKKDGVHYKNGKAVCTETGINIIKNVKTAGTPKLWKINAQDLYSGNLHPQSRSKVMKEFHKYFGDILTNNLVKSLKNSKIEVKKDQRLAFYYTFEGKLENNKSDINNKSYLYDKAFTDTMTEKSLTNDKQKDVIKLGIIKDDSLEYIYSNHFEFFEKDNEKLIIHIYLCDKNFSVPDLLNKTYNL
jgi:hypothetical protein